MTAEDLPKLTWIEGIVALTSYFDRWQDLAERTGADIFLSPQWFKSWWPELGGRRRLVALVAEQEGRLVGFLPFMVDRMWVGPIYFDVGRLAASDPYCITFTLPVEPALVTMMLRAASEGLLSRFGCSIFSLTPVSDLASFRQAVLDLATAPELGVTQMPQGTHTVFDLPDSFDTYLMTQISGKRRGQYRRQLKGFQETFDIQNRVFVPSQQDFDAFVDFHNVQWHLVGKGGHFSDWPRSHQVYRALGPLTQGRRGLRFFSQTGNEGPLATQLCFMSDKTCFWRLPARSLDPRADKLGIGKMGLMMMIQDLIATGVTRIESGPGVYEYKTEHGGQNIPLSRMIISRRTGRSRLALRVLLAWSELVEFFYYRVWFKKLAPRIRKLLRLPARPLWTTWIKSRI